MHDGGLERALGQAIQEARKTAGFTQQRLCELTGLSYSTLAKIERGAIKSPSVFTVQTIASATHTSVEWLVGIMQGEAGRDSPFKTSKSGIKLVYFDVNGVLVRFFQRAFTQLAEDTGNGPDVVEGVFWHFNDAVCRGSMPVAEFNKEMAHRLGVSKVDWQKYYFDAIDPVPESIECLQWAAAHYRVGLITNIFPGFLEALQQRGILPSLPEIITIDSSKVGTIKPEEAIYVIAEEKAGVKPEEILMIDDSRANLSVAEKRGWHVLWFEYYNTQEGVERIRSALEF